MKIAIFFLMIILVTFSSTLLKSDTQTLLVSSSDNLGFSNYTGSGCTESEFNTFIEKCIEAYETNHYDIQALSYIRRGMCASFGNYDSKYSVILQTSDSAYGWTVYATGSEMAATSSGVNWRKPDHSYMFIRIDDYNPLLMNVYFAVTATGLGITATTKQAITNIILQEEGSYCSCSTTNIQQKVKNYDGQNWSVVCSSSYNHYFYIYVKDSQYIYFKPKNCYYTLWVSS